MPATTTDLVPSIPTYDQLMQPLLDALHALGGTASGQQLHQHIVEPVSIEVVDPDNLTV